MSVLNLQKGAVLDLTKKDPALNNILVGVGWDIAKPKAAGGFFGNLFAAAPADFDLDLFALQLDANGKLLTDGVVYYAKQKHQGIFLHGDNLTGAGEGDDEKISVDLSKVIPTCAKIVIGVAIYSANARKQSFSQVQNAYVRLVDETKGNSEICRFNLTEQGGDNTAIVMADLTRTGSDWSFQAIGNYVMGDIAVVMNMYK
ncbi:MAG: TerD family protein [Culicoidibacterales bacterium]